MLQSNGNLPDIFIYSYPISFPLNIVSFTKRTMLVNIADKLY